MVNENNYIGSSATVVGVAGGQWEVKTLGTSGYEQAELSIAVGKGYKKDGEWVDQGTDWYRLVAKPDYASDNWPEVEKGDRVRVDDAKLEARVYKKNDGEPGLELRLSFGALSVVKKAEAREKADLSGGFV